MRKNFSHPSGFTFMESLITFSVMGIFLALTWATVQFLLMKSNDQMLRTRAHFLAIEGIEILKQIRQTAVNQNRETGFWESIGKKDGSYLIQSSENGFSLTSGKNELIEMSDEPFINYCRTIEISGDSKSLKKIDSMVRWGGSDCQEGQSVIRYSTYLADIKSNFK